MLHRAELELQGRMPGFDDGVTRRPIFLSAHTRMISFFSQLSLTSRADASNLFTNHERKALSLFKKGPLALVAGEDLNLRPLGYE
jgi:hypothetical protein